MVSDTAIGLGNPGSRWTTQQAIAHIETLDISEKWKDRFRVIATGEPFVKGVPHNYRPGTLQSSWVLGFLFGPFYYMCLRMWEKAFLLLSLALLYGAALQYAENVSGTPFPNVVYYLPLSVYCAMMAPIDYYKLLVHRTKLWRGFEWVRNEWVAAALFTVILAILVVLTLSGIANKDIS